MPADGFYEWRGGRNERAPFHIALPGGELFAFAGLWERWRRPDDGGVLESVSIVTTAATPNIQPLHTRMPIALPKDAQSQWLDPEQADATQAVEFARERAMTQFVYHMVNPRVNNSRSEGAELIEPFANPA